MIGISEPTPAGLTILHLDMDAFFAAVEVLDRPELGGKPLVVGAAPDARGVVSTASYEARKFGIHSAMPSRTAFKLCPQAIFVPVRMERYAAVSQQIMTILESVTPFIEPVSIDEAFLDVAGVLKRWPDVVAIAIEMKRRIKAQTGLTASVGVAVNKFLAKLASDLQKPDGLTVVPADPDGLLEFLKPLPIGRIWGVGKVTGAQFAKVGIHTIGDAQTTDESALAAFLGPAMAHHVYRLARGLDERPVVPASEEKSISNETTFPEDCTNPEVERQTLLELAEEVGHRLRAAGKVARTAQIKVRFDDFSTISRQAPLRPPANSDTDLIRQALALFAREKVTRPVRLLGFGVSQLLAPGASVEAQPTLFEPEADTKAGEAARERLDHTVDELRRRFGSDILKRGNWRK